jgi:acyl carrier protein
VISFVELVASVLGMAENEVTDQIGPRVFPGWTSLRHVQLVIAIEANYGVSFSREEIRSFTSVGAVRRGLLEKGVAA